ncbi:MAG: GntR family transcriptional regulator [Gemmatimonadota bacterium]
MPEGMRVRREAPVPVHRQIVSQLEAEILDGRLPPGRRLPSLRALADRLRVHRNTVAAAYRVLQRGGLVRTAPGSGVYVRSLVAPDDALAGALRRLLLAQRAAGLAAPEILAGVRAWIGTLEAGRLAVVEEEPGLLALLTREVRGLFPAAEIRGIPLDKVRGRPGQLGRWIPLARPHHLDELRLRLPPWSEVLPLRARLPHSLTSRLERLRLPAVVAVVSVSEVVRRRVQEVAWRVHGEAIGFVESHPSDGARLARAARLADLIVSDAPSLQRLPLEARPRCIEIRLVDRGSLREVGSLLEGIRQKPTGRDGKHH